MAILLETIRGLTSKTIFFRKVVVHDQRNAPKYNKLLCVYAELGGLDFEENQELSEEVRDGLRTFSYEGYAEKLLNEAQKDEVANKLRPSAVVVLRELDGYLKNLRNGGLDLLSFEGVHRSLASLEALISSRTNNIDKKRPIIEAYAFVLLQNLIEEKECPAIAEMILYYRKVLDFYGKKQNVLLDLAGK